MNDSAQDQPSQVKPQVFRPSISYHYLWIISLVFFLIILLFGLNYLNILPLSKGLPNQFGWLPRKISRDGILEAGNELVCIPEKYLRISNKLLVNYLVTQWRGSVDGNLTEVSENSITLSKENHSIEIPITNATFFFEEKIIDKRKEATKTKLNSTYIGWNARGSFFVYGRDTDGKDKIVGSDFTFYK